MHTGSGAPLFSSAESRKPAIAEITKSAIPTWLTRSAARSGFIALSPFFPSIDGTLTELLHQFLNRETASPGARHKLRHQLPQLPPPLDFIRLDLLETDERARPLLRLEHPANLEFAI